MQKEVMAINYKKTAKDLAVLGIVLLVIVIGIQALFGTTNPFYVVSSGSMVPELNVYDIIIIQGNLAFAEVEVGDIIVYDRPSDHDKVIVHRIASIIDDDPKTVRTKGDANPTSYPGVDFPVTEAEYRGTVLYVIPQAGYIAQFLQPPTNYVIIGVMGSILLFFRFKRK